MTLGLGGLREEQDLAFEVGQLAEVLVDAGKPQVGDLVELAETVEHLQTDPLTRQRVDPFESEAILYRYRERLELALVDRPVLGRSTESTENLRAIERDPVARALHYVQDNFFETLERGEASSAHQALPAATDGGAVVSRPRVDDLVIVLTAGGAPHAPTLPTAGARHPSGRLQAAPFT